MFGILCHLPWYNKNKHGRIQYVIPPKCFILVTKVIYYTSFLHDYLQLFCIGLLFTIYIFFILCSLMIYIYIFFYLSGVVDVHSIVEVNVLSTDNFTVPL